MPTSFSLTYEQITACAERQMALYSETAAVLTAAVPQAAGVDIAIAKTERAAVYLVWEQLVLEMSATSHAAYEADKARFLSLFQ
ncbi:hypothetical protein [Trinickia sp.]|uniref:hypothetical protein n=1 Tax=Trinickia sp. TaxID=2571163 RepID=UPI003F81A8AF